MQSDLDRLTNQARFIKMIIDSKLVVSKKKKAVLVEELRRLGFKAIAKAVEAKKAGETEPTVDDEESDEEGAVNASDYDYLLGMAIWSLTQERVEKLLRQIGEKELQIDALIKRAPKELWMEDLNAFIDEWHTQLSEEKIRKKKNATVGRRGSAKLGLTAKAKRKRKGEDDSDEDFVTGKKQPTLKAVLDRTKGKSALSSYFNKEAESKPEASKDDDFMDVDDWGYSQPPEIKAPVVAVKEKAKSTAAAKAKIIKKEPTPALKAEESDLSNIDDVFAAVAKQAGTRKASDPPLRQARAVAAKKKTYALSSSDEDDSFASNGDDLGDVSMMVKGIGTSSGENTLTGNRVLLHNTTGRPSSAHGLPRSISKHRLTMDHHQNDDSDGMDETNYDGLIPQGSPLRPAARRAAETKPVDHDDVEDSFDVAPIPAKQKVIAKKKAAPISKPKTAASKTGVSKPEPVPKKPITLSPSAKAYAAKQAKLQAAAAAAAEKKPASVEKKAVPAKKKKAVLSEDEDDELANEILSDDEPVVARPSRRAVSAQPGKKTTKYVFSSDDEDEEEEEEDSFLVDDDSE
jgi:DNA topoisomerase II